MSDPASGSTVTRRGVLAAGGAALLGVAGGYAIAVRGEPGASAAPALSPSPTTSALAGSASPTAATARTIPFFGTHQAGVETPPALLQTFIGLDLREPGRDAGEAALRLITDDAARLTQGRPALGDTEETLAVNPQGLTISVGLGRPFFEHIGRGDRIPAQLPQIPAFATDAFEEPWGQTDLLLQVGSDDAVTLAHAIRMLTKDLSTLAEVRWMQPGFRSATPANPGSESTRNLMGQVDGTINPAPGTAGFDEVVWIAEGEEWVRGGTVLILRRIRMLLDTWEILDRPAQEAAIGRQLASGAPLGRTHELDPVPFDERDADGLPIIPTDSHIAVAHARTMKEMILRRPYNYDNGMHDGTNDVGLLFAAYTADPVRSFIPMQQRIAESDAFNRWNTTIGSAAYLFPRGAAEGEILAEGLFT